MLGIVALREDTVDEANWIIDKKEWCLREKESIGNGIRDKGARNERIWTEFWGKNLPLLEHIEKNARPILHVMEELSAWLTELSKTYTLFWIAKPAAYDWMWLKIYYEELWVFDLMKGQKFPIGFKAECINGYRETVKACAPERLDEFLKFITPAHLAHTHHALDDAMEQGWMYMKSRQWVKQNLTFKISQPDTVMSWTDKEEEKRNQGILESEWVEEKPRPPITHVDYLFQLKKNHDLRYSVDYTQ